MIHNARLRAGMIIGSMLVLVLGGCNDLLRPQPFSADIRRIAVFHATNPWVNFDQATYPKPEGIKFSFYLIDGKTQRGIFASGTCVVELFASENPDDVSVPMSLVREWRIPMDEVPRGSKETPLGLGYSLRLDWRPLDLEGRPIELRVKLEQPNGNVVQSQVKRFDVMRSRPPAKSPPVSRSRAKPPMQKTSSETEDQNKTRLEFGPSIP